MVTAETRARGEPAAPRRRTLSNLAPLLLALRVLVARAAEGLGVLAAVATFVFLAVRLLPGDPAALVLGDQATLAERAALRQRLQLDLPLWVQYARMFPRLLTGSGESLRHPGHSAGELVGAALGPTAALACTAVAVGAVAGSGLALLAVGPWLGTRRRWIERGASAVAATPLLAFAPVATYALAARLRVVPLPGDPDAGAAGLLFGAGLLALPLAAHVARVGRVALEAVRSAPFLTVARAKGGSTARVWLLHALPPAAAPILTVVGAQLGALLGGAVVLERLFERPGLGSLVLSAYASRDLPVLELAIVASGALFVAVQMATAALVAAVDPRAR